MWPLLIAGAASGVLKNIEGNAQAKAERQRQGAIARYSPWTGMQAHAVQDPSLMGDIATGASIGAAANGMMNGATTPGTGDLISGGGATNPNNFDLMAGANQQPSWMRLAQNQGSSPYSLYSK